MHRSIVVAKGIPLKPNPRELMDTSHVSRVFTTRPGRDHADHSPANGREAGLNELRPDHDAEHPRLGSMPRTFSELLHLKLQRFDDATLANWPGWLEVCFAHSVRKTTGRPWEDSIRPWKTLTT